MEDKSIKTLIYVGFINQEFNTYEFGFTDF